MKFWTATCLMRQGDGEDVSGAGGAKSEDSGLERGAGGVESKN